MTNISQVAIIRYEPGEAPYPKPPFNPPVAYAEFGRGCPYPQRIDADNRVYDQVRELLASLRLDVENFGTQGWNPFRELVKKGDRVVIKPNLVFDSHPIGMAGVEAMVTHASVVRPLVDYLLLATGGDVRITICDVPLQNADWDRIIACAGYRELVEFYANERIDIELLDLRFEVTLKNKEGLVCRRVRAEKDPRGYVVVDLKEKSCLYPIREDAGRLEITDYGKGTVGRHHNGSCNEYLLARTVLDADVFINVPKMKTHRKAGVTLAMKNLVGTNGDKSWIAHHRRGVDECPRFHLKSYLKWYGSYYLKLYAPLSLTTLVYKAYRKLFLGGQSIKGHGMTHGGILMEGNWYGNDTVWRTIVDLNNIILYCDRDGQMQDKIQRKYLAIVDGIVGMDKEGPMDGLPMRGQVLVGGFHPVAVDYLAAYVMGFSPMEVPQIREGFAEENYGLTPFAPEDVSCRGNVDWRQFNLGFTPSRGWRGHLERAGSAVASGNDDNRGGC